MRGTLLFFILSALLLQGCDGSRSESAGDRRALARAAMPGLGAETPAEAGDTTPMVVRRLWHYPDGLEFWGGPSPDGRYLSYVDWWTGDLALHDFISGEDRHLTDEASLDDSEFAVMSAFAPDGRRVAYSWENGRFDELRIRTLGEAGHRVVIADSAMNIHPVEWSADGGRILVLIDRYRAREGEPRNELGLVSVDEGSLNIVKSLPGPGPFRTSLSPDARYIIYDQPSDRDPPDRDLHIIEVASGRDRILVDHPAKDLVLGWAPDGDNVLFASDRTGTLAAWRLPVEGGEVAGEPLLVKPELWRIEPLGFARDGSFFYGVNMAMADVYVAGLNPSTGALVDPPTRISQGFLGANQAGPWSPDGRFLVYLSLRSLLLGDVGSEVLVIYSAETGDVRELHPNLHRLYWPEWSPDGRSILLWSSDSSGDEGLFLVDVQTGKEQLVVRPAPGEVRLRGKWSPDGRSIFTHVMGEEGTRIEVRNQEGIVQDTLISSSQSEGLIGSDFAPSADGSSLAFYRRSPDGAYSVEILSIPDGEVRRVATFDAHHPHPQLIHWGPGGEYVYFQNMGGPEAQEERGVWRFPVAGGDPEQVNWSAGEECILSGFHPSGHRVALTCTEGEGGDEVWVMEDFLPGPEDAQQGRRTP